MHEMFSFSFFGFGLILRLVTRYKCAAAIISRWHRRSVGLGENAPAPKYSLR
jgi:hypothetical protein